MENNRLKTLSYLSLLSAVIFYVFFMASKHVAFLSNVTPFLEDPYDAVGSFLVLTAVPIVIFNLVRLAVLKKYEIAGRGLYIIRGNLIVGWSIVITLLADCISVINTPPHKPLMQAEAVLFSAMAGLLFLSFMVLVTNHLAQKDVLTLQDLETETEMDVLFRPKFLSPINPGIHQLMFSIVFSISFSLLLAMIEIIGEGPAPTFQQTVLVFAILTLIGTAGFFVILMLLGRYLGILGKMNKRT